MTSRVKFLIAVFNCTVYWTRCSDVSCFVVNVLYDSFFFFFLSPVVLLFFVFFKLRVTLYSCWSCISPFCAFWLRLSVIEMPRPVDVPVTLHLRLISAFAAPCGPWCALPQYSQRRGVNMISLILFSFVSDWLSDQVKPQKWRMIICESLFGSCEHWTQCFHNSHANDPKTSPEAFSVQKVDVTQKPIIMSYYVIIMQTV